MLISFCSIIIISMGKLEFQFSLSDSTQFDFYTNIKVVNMLQLKAIIIIIFIFAKPFSSCVTDRYQPKQYLRMETETEISMIISIYRY